MNESAERLRAIFDGTFGLIGLLAPDGTLIDANRAALRFAGVERGDVVGRPFWEGPWWGGDAAVRERVRDAVAAAGGGQFVRFEARHVDADGVEHVLDFSLTPVRDEDDAVLFLIPEGRDITAQKRVEEALRESEAKFAGIVSIASDAIVSVDEEQNVLLFNQGAEEIFGYAADEVIGRPLSMLLPENARDRHAADVAAFGRSPTTARRMGERREVAGRRRSGEIFPAEASISRLELDGRRIYTAVIRDVTERRRWEEQLRLLQTLALAIGESKDMHSALATALEQVCHVTGWAYGEVWMPDASGERIVPEPVVFASEPALKRFHEASRGFSFEPGSGLPGRAWTSREPVRATGIGDDPAFARAAHARDVGLTTAVAIPILAEDVVVAVIAFYNHEAGPEDARFVTLVSAVAAQLGSVILRKRVEEELAVKAEELARSNAELEQFASVASHDLQEPLRKITAFGDRLDQRYGDRLDETGRDYLARMRNAAMRMQALIEDLLTFSRVTTKARPFTPVDLNATAREVLADLETRIEQTGGAVHVEKLPVVEADPFQMRSLLQNLISNALKFHRDGVPPIVRIRAERLPPERGADGRAPQRVCIMVEDNGIGFDEVYLDRVFGVFQRLHGRGTFEGTGMGLAICRKIAERHGGSITARSEPGAGSTFIVTLPVHRPRTGYA